MRKYKIVNEDYVNKYFRTRCFLLFSNEAEAEVKNPETQRDGKFIHRRSVVLYLPLAVYVI